MNSERPGLRKQPAESAYFCPACRNVVAHTYRFSLKGCEIWQCRQCGLGRTETAGFDPKDYYTDRYFTGQEADGYADYLGAETVLRREFAKAVQLIRRFCPTGKLLEIGCAYGFFLKEAEPYFDVYGIEPVKEATAHARRAGLKVLSGLVDGKNMGEIGDVDVIVLFDVIEHLPDPAATLAICASHLRPGGVVVITTGDFTSPLARLTGAHWRLMTPPQHLWFFNQRSLAGMLSPLDLRLEHASHPWKVVPLSLIFFQLGRMFGIQRPVGHFSTVGVPVNLFDALRVVFRKY